MTVQLSLNNEAATLKLGQQLAQIISVGMIIYLQGELGAGKTTLVRGLLQGFGHQGKVKSPTYALVEPYEQLSLPIYHFDLYRLDDPESLEMIGLRDYLSPNSICVFEWPNKGVGFIPKPDLTFALECKSKGREAIIVPGSELGIGVLKQGERIWRKTNFGREY